MGDDNLLARFLLIETREQKIGILSEGEIERLTQG